MQTRAVTRKPRTDAAYNRRHILAVAHEAFGADGLDLPVREVARRAGLGAATVYRHFPSREDLVDAVLAQQVDGVASYADRGKQHRGVVPHDPVRLGGIPLLPAAPP